MIPIPPTQTPPPTLPSRLVLEQPGREMNTTDLPGQHSVQYYLAQFERFLALMNLARTDTQGWNHFTLASTRLSKVCLCGQSFTFTPASTRLS